MPASTVVFAPPSLATNRTLTVAVGDTKSRTWMVASSHALCSPRTVSTFVQLAPPSLLTITASQSKSSGCPVVSECE